MLQQRKAKIRKKDLAAQKGPRCYSFSGLSVRERIFGYVEPTTRSTFHCFYYWVYDKVRLRLKSQLGQKGGRRMDDGRRIRPKLVPYPICKLDDGAGRWQAQPNEETQSMRWDDWYLSGCNQDPNTWHFVYIAAIWRSLFENNLQLLPVFGIICVLVCEILVCEIFQTNLF